MGKSTSEPGGGGWDEWALTQVYEVARQDDPSTPPTWVGEKKQAM